jgi:hypothetical protein
MKVELNVEVIGTFERFQQWVNRASSILSGYKNEEIICLDSKGNMCHIGADFMMADKKGTFPVTAYRIIRAVEAYKNEPSVVPPIDRTPVQLLLDFIIEQKLEIGEYRLLVDPIRERFEVLKHNPNQKDALVQLIELVVAWESTPTSATLEKWIESNFIIKVKQ